MDMWTVLDTRGHIVARSRLREVAEAYLTAACVLLLNGEPVAA